MRRTRCSRCSRSDAALSDEYNHKLLDGKWDHMMDQTHIGYMTWNDPPANVMPAVSWIQVPETGSLGVSAEDATFSRAGGRFGFSLGTIDSVVRQTRTLTLFDRGKTPVEYDGEDECAMACRCRRRRERLAAMSKRLSCT